MKRRSHKHSDRTARFEQLNQMMGQLIDRGRVEASKLEPITREMSELAGLVGAEFDADRYQPAAPTEKKDSPAPPTPTGSTDERENPAPAGIGKAILGGLAAMAGIRVIRNA